MIAKMKKLTFLIYHKEYEAFLKELQELGVLHVQTAQEGFMESDSRLDQKIRQVNHLHEIIESLSVVELKNDNDGDAKNAEVYVSKIDELTDALHVHELDIQKLRKDVENLAPWGDFSPEKVKGLQAIGYGMNFYICQAKDFKEAAGITGIVLTKLDGTAKGGVVLAINNELDVPVKFVGVGEKIEDLQPFDADAFAAGLFDAKIPDDDKEITDFIGCQYF